MTVTSPLLLDAVVDGELPGVAAGGPPTTPGACPPDEAAAVEAAPLVLVR